ncbi:uncharacterized protein BDV14DRAFT_85116 [Aspergillus stella-maris]|uniref:uncharacterized protein n=1 Tax=Aspergillus stella-maris TaxID=1810926 RepID=UPI003CCCEF91
MSFNPDEDHLSYHDMLSLLYDDIAQLVDITNSTEPPFPYESNQDRYTALRRAIIEHSVKHIKLWCEEVTEIGQSVVERSLTESPVSQHHSNPADDLDKELSPIDPSACPDHVFNPEDNVPSSNPDMGRDPKGTDHATDHDHDHDEDHGVMSDNEVEFQARLKILDADERRLGQIKAHISVLKSLLDASKPLDFLENAVQEIHLTQ